MLPARFASLDSAAVKAKARFPRAFDKLLARAIGDGTFPLDWGTISLAMARTAILKRGVPPAEYGEEAIAYRRHYSRHFVSGTMDLRLGRADYYKDAERSLFVGRVGEALGYLFVRRVLGYKAVAHVEHAWRRLRMQPLSRRLSRPDFVLGSGPDLALAEFKGAVNEGRGASVGGLLRRAHAQCEEVKRRTGAPVGSTHAVATFLGYGGKGSFVCHSDPPDDAPAPEFPRAAWEETVAQLDLGASLHLAGFEDLGAAVIDPRRRGMAAPIVVMDVLPTGEAVPARPPGPLGGEDVVSIDADLVQAALQLVREHRSEVRSVLLGVRTRRDEARPRGWEGEGEPVGGDGELRLLPEQAWVQARRRVLEG